jgi:hypothetical protein
MKQDKACGACSMHGRDKNFFRVFVGKPEEKITWETYAQRGG